jgi:hypothetical protein
LGNLSPLGDAGVDLDGQSRWHQLPRLLEMAFAQRLRVIDEDGAPFTLSLYFGSLGRPVKSEGSAW